MSQQDTSQQGASQQGASQQAAARSPRWGAADIPDQAGRTAVVTGANSGIGLEAARYLAAHGAHVVLACRDTEKAKAAAGAISAQAPGAEVDVVALDLSELASVRRAAQEIRSAYPRLDLLINNAGLMMPPYGRTKDGFELQFGTNHLGHFALTGLVLPSLLEVPGSRVVTISSNGHKVGRVHFDDLQFEHRYGRMRAYGQSKLANLLFTYELQRRLAAAGAPTIATAAHPGTSDTALVRYMPVCAQWGARLTPSQDARMGALPTLRAATDPAAAGGDYYGPSGLGEFAGPPRRVRSSARSHDVDAQRRLWDISERLTDVRFGV
ncbi:MAG TPA: SDR family NAD(P)-dependent oxidoreductase [Streptosporangiaceae bacterium]|jgi:NAD(P)-dependent dehydrogenase (short-subunit alcohol dehydrogenase family)